MGVDMMRIMPVILVAFENLSFWADFTLPIDILLTIYMALIYNIWMVILLIIRIGMG